MGLGLRGHLDSAADGRRNLGPDARGNRRATSDQHSSRHRGHGLDQHAAPARVRHAATCFDVDTARTNQHPRSNQYAPADKHAAADKYCGAEPDAAPDAHNRADQDARTDQDGRTDRDAGTGHQYAATAAFRDPGAARDRNARRRADSWPNGRLLGHARLAADRHTGREQRRSQDDGVRHHRRKVYVRRCAVAR